MCSPRVLQLTFFKRLRSGSVLFAILALYSSRSESTIAYQTPSTEILYSSSSSIHCSLRQAMEMRRHNEQTVAVLALILTMLVGGSALELAA
jgi:hypothetical protein